jgi:hypothetical protein
VHQHDPLVAAAVLGVLQAVASGLGLDEELSDPFGHQRGRGLASADYDGDGDLDLVLTQNGDSARLLRNDLNSASATPHWLRVRLIGSGSQSSRTPYGSRVTAIIGERRLERWLGSGHSYLSASEPVVTFGLGTYQAIDRLEIEWPSGQVQNVPSPALDQLILVEESSTSPTETP